MSQMQVCVHTHTTHTSTHELGTHTLLITVAFKHTLSNRIGTRMPSVMFWCLCGSSTRKKMMNYFIIK